jgi:predicted RNA-binding Zn-ribbon protein involved in translation (DUF1610 family)
MIKWLNRFLQKEAKPVVQSERAICLACKDYVDVEAPAEGSQGFDLVFDCPNCGGPAFAGHLNGMVAAVCYLSENQRRKP